MPIPKPARTTPLNSGSQSKLYVKGRLDTSDWTEDDAVPLSRELGFTPTGNIVTVPLFGEDFDRAVKTGKGGTLMIGTVAPSGHPILDILHNAADAVGPNAQIRFLVVNPDNRAYTGFTVVEAPAPQYDSRGVFGYNFNSTLDGQYIPFAMSQGDVKPAINIASISIAPEDPTVAVGQTVVVSGAVLPNNARQNVVWSTSNPAVALVNSQGVVTGVTAGTATITVESAYDRSVADSVTVTVTV